MSRRTPDPKPRKAHVERLANAWFAHYQASKSDSHSAEAQRAWAVLQRAEDNSTPGERHLAWEAYQRRIGT